MYRCMYVPPNNELPRRPVSAVQRKHATYIRLGRAGIDGQPPTDVITGVMSLCHLSDVKLVASKR